MAPQTIHFSITYETFKFFIKFMRNMNKEYVELNNFMKLKFLITTGGQAKILIRSGKVVVNGECETRNKKKLVSGDKVEYEGQILVVNLKDFELEDDDL